MEDAGSELGVTVASRGGEGQDHRLGRQQGDTASIAFSHLEYSETEFPSVPTPKQPEYNPQHVELHVDPFAEYRTRGLSNHIYHKMLLEWSQPVSNRRPPACKDSC